MGFSSLTSTGNKVRLQIVEPSIHILTGKLDNLLRWERDGVLLNLEKLELIHVSNICRYRLYPVLGDAQHLFHLTCELNTRLVVF